MAGPNLRVDIGGDGTIQTLEVKAAGEWEEVKFRSGILAGPAWAGVQLHRLTEAEAHFTGTADGVRHSLLYRLENDRLAIIASIKNERPATYAPKAARLVIGIDCEMRSFPSWNDRYFPTLLRCEKSHFWGYLMTPKGRISMIHIQPGESVVSRVHLDLRKRCDVSVTFADSPAFKVRAEGLQWIGPRGLLDLLR
jgi:hypothetical protein